jgi:transcriptional regulator with XRE-family HTH domain
MTSTGVSSATVSALERGTYEPTTEVLARMGEALRMDLDVRFFPGTGPLLRDHIQAAMVETPLRGRHVRWSPVAEVWVTRPLGGVIDLLPEPADAHEPLVAAEAGSELRRLERQIRWARAKAAALEQARV